MTLPQFELAWPWMLLSLLLPLASYRLLPKTATHHQNALLFPFAQMLNNMKQHKPADNTRLIKWLALLAWCCLVFAAARPQWVGDSVNIPVSGRSLMLAVDISGSMENEDMLINRQPVSRLTAVKAVAGEFIEKREGDYLGLILFGLNAYLQSPLSYDRQTVRILLNEAVVGLAGKDTAIGDAIGLAVKRLRRQPAENRILILLTDGANTAGAVEPLKAADLAAQEGIKIYTIGVGDSGIKVGGIFGLRTLGSDLDETTLKAIAAKTGGRYFRARDINELQKIYALLDEIEPVSDEQQSFRPVKELYQWPLVLALILAMMTGIVRRTTSHV